MKIVQKKDFDFQYDFDDYYFSFKLYLDKVIVCLYINTKYDGILDIVIRKKEKQKRRNINLNIIIKQIADFINNVNLYVKQNDELFDKDFLKRQLVKHIDIYDLKIENNDLIEINKQFQNLTSIFSENCNYYSNCNLEIIKAIFKDHNSIIYNMDSLNCFSGKIMHLNKTTFKRKNTSFLHINSIIIKLEKVNIDYERFFITTDATNLRSLTIYNHPKLNHEDLLFISGFYNLEKIDINGVVHDYNQIKKLDKLREMLSIYCDNKYELEVQLKNHKNFIDKHIVREDFYLLNYLMHQNLFNYQRLLSFYQKLYVPKLKRIKFLDKINIDDIEKIKKELIMIEAMSFEEKKQILREKKEHTLFDSLNNLNYVEEKEEEFDLINSKPFESGGIDYYVKSKKIKLIK
ncbi:MAG: hypothetical protein PHN42_02710 [Bacilli bacterium]|nr:hypothetical protein [Bacilli bacterium]